MSPPAALLLYGALVLGRKGLTSAVTHPFEQVPPLVPLIVDSEVPRTHSFYRYHFVSAISLYTEQHLIGSWMQTKVLASSIPVLVPGSVMMMMMFIGTETLVTQLVYERSRMHPDRVCVTGHGYRK